MKLKTLSVFLAFVSLTAFLAHADPVYVRLGGVGAALYFNDVTNAPEILAVVVIFDADSNFIPFTGPDDFSGTLALPMETGLASATSFFDVFVLVGDLNSPGCATDAGCDVLPLTRFSIDSVNGSTYGIGASIPGRDLFFTFEIPGASDITANLDTFCNFNLDIFGNIHGVPTGDFSISWVEPPAQLPEVPEPSTLLLLGSGMLLLGRRLALGPG